ncbi:MAG: efflux RND transporter periplasmic adaptor subunit [Sedimentisphaerales bacterium]|nr:efflux RND transporter periplasmic adaptor subunit [Sedimentisphaerales bacterium]
MKMDDIYSKVKNKSGTARSIIAKHKIFVFRVILPLLIIIVGGLYVAYLLKTSPKSKRQPPLRQARLVEVISIEHSDVPIKIDAMGTVIAAQEVDLKSQVQGKIMELSPELIRGGIFEKNQMLMKIEPDDYALLVTQRESDVAAAETNLKLEYGNQAIAEQEYKLLEGVISENDKELVLRKPQLSSSMSSLQAAKARLQQAKIDLGRTNIVAPFNSIVKNKYIDLGAMVSQSTTLVTLIGTDEYWVEVMVPVDQLKWIAVPRQNNDAGSEARIYNSSAWGNNGTYRTGSVIRLSPDIETQGRMAKLLVSVKDPLSLNTEKVENELLLGSYVRVEIQGQTVKSAHVLDRGLLHDGDNIWLLTADNTLDIMAVDVIYRGENEVVIYDGISSSDKIITTDLAAPVEGMLLRLRTEGASTIIFDDKDFQGSSGSGTK